MTNNSLMEATGGAVLSISGITLTQVSPGQLSASGTSSLITLVGGATISGGALNTSSSGVIQATNSSVDTLSGVTNNGTLNVIGASGLNITGNLVNDGTITVNSNNSGASTMTFSGGTLSGTGTITLNSGTTGAVIAGSLTQSSGHSIDGYGEIVGSLINNGTVDASVNGQTLILTTNGMTNNSLMEATGGAVLSISGITLTQVSPGQLSASGTSSLITLVGGATISGGALNTFSGGVIQATNSSVDTLASLTSNATFNIIGGSDVNVTGNLVDNGTITVNSNNSGVSTMTFAGGTLSGTGTITLNSGTTGAVIAGTLTQSSGHTINGYGEITAALTNNATVNASVSSQTLTLTTGPIGNSGVIESTGGGILAIGSVTITQHSGGQINPSTGTVQFTGGATITGGTLGAGTINNTSGTNTIGALTNNSTLNVIGGTNLNISSAIVNDGVLSVDSNTSSVSTVTASGAITGTGTISIQSGGKLAFATNLAPSTQSSLSITGSGVLDINNNKLFIDYGSGTDPIASIEQWIKDGFDSLGGPEIISSAIATDDSTSGLSYGIGYADGADGVVAGLPSGEIEIMLTLLGDANLDGTVNSEDFTQFSEHLGQSGQMWDDGDFNYDGTVNTEDFTLFSHNLGETAVLASQTAGVLESADSISLSNVPEPASMAMMVMAGAGILRRRRRSAS
jgi:fibronectin-binding autotransporter adhesin